MALVFDGTVGISLPNWTTDGRPAAPSPGQFGYNTTLRRYEFYNGTGWIKVV